MLPELTDALVNQRQQAINIFKAGVIAANPYLAVLNCLRVEQQKLCILNPQQPHLNRSGDWPKIQIVALGKAACAMADAAQAIIPEPLMADSGIVVTNYENMRCVPRMQVIGAGHPCPDLAGQQAAQQIALKVSTAAQGGLVLVLISGGGSALFPAPRAPITLADKIVTTQLLLASGATINEVNCVRKHLSILKGGGLARLAAPAQVHTLILSDVLDNDVSAIASGPTVPDHTSFADALAVVKSKVIWDHLPVSVQNVLLQGEAGIIPETPKAHDPIFKNTGYTIIGSNGMSVDAALQTAQMENYDAQLYSYHLQGEAREVATQMVQKLQHTLAGISKPTAFIAGGETTVTLKGNGKGGRNQEFALAFALAAKQCQLPPCWTFLSGGTDGRDGPTDAAGGVVDGYTLARLEAKGLNAQALLDNNDAYNALQNTQDLLMIGATGTNVADLQILLVQPA